MSGCKVLGMTGKLTDITLAFIMYAIAATWVIYENPKLRHTIIRALSAPAWFTAAAAYPIAWYNRRTHTTRLVGWDDFNYRFFYTGQHRSAA